MFNFKTVQENDSLLPDGMYEAKIEGAEYKDSKKDGTPYLNLKFKILGPSHKGMFLFSIYNIFNKNDQARNIALRDIKKILKAQRYDVEKLDNVSKEKLTEMLLSGKQIQIAVGNVTDSFGPKNKITKYLELEVVKIETSDIPF